MRVALTVDRSPPPHPNGSPPPSPLPPRPSRRYNTAYDLWSTLAEFETLTRLDMCRELATLRRQRDARTDALAAENAALKAQLGLCY